MDANRFDHLTKRVATPGSRRGFIRGLAATALAGLGGSIVGRQASAQSDCMDVSVCGGGYCGTGIDIHGDCICHSFPLGNFCRGYTCTSNADCVQHNGVCMDIGCEPGLGTCMPVCETAQESTQSCPVGTTWCNGACVDTSSDKQNCGACGNVCSVIDGITYETNACIDGQCGTVCGADLCGDDCIDLNMGSTRHCGACGNQCADGEMCCGGRCFNPNDYERYCDYCGYQGGFTQGCNADEICDGGLCVPVAEAQPAEARYRIVSQICEEYLQLFEPPYDALTDTAFALPGCYLDDGVGYMVQDARTGEVLGECITQDGICDVMIPWEAKDPSIPEGANVIVTQTMLLAGVEPDPAPGILSNYAFFINVGTPDPNEVEEPDAAVVSETVPENGQFAYAVRVGDHWSVWNHDFATGENVELANEPNSDQFAPNYSHDGAHIAYVSDQVDLINQIWVMDADGANQRQVSSFSGAGQFMHAAWSSDDSRLIVTQVDEDENRLMLMPAEGGELESFVDGWATFASTGTNGSVAYVAQADGDVSVIYALESDPGVRTDTIWTKSSTSSYPMFGSPNLSVEGDFLAYDAGAYGQRRVEIAKLGGGPLVGVPYSGFDDSNPVWSPDHYFLAYVVEQEGRSDVVTLRVNSDGTPAPVATTSHDKIWYLTWRP